MTRGAEGTALQRPPRNGGHQPLEETGNRFSPGAFTESSPADASTAAQ